MSEEPAPGRRSRSRIAASDDSIPIEYDDLVLLARRYADQAMYDEAIHLYEMAAKLRPGSAGLKIRISILQAAKQKTEADRSSYLRESVLLENARDVIDAGQYVGLAEFYLAKDQSSKAIELLELAKLKAPNNYRPWFILGRAYFAEGEWELARQEIEQARSLNPFDLELAELSGRVFFELKEFERSLDEFIDAFLLSTSQKGVESEPLRRLINTVKRVLE
ncbi:MAG TPA: tetratricopeptide repeat protein, partial [Thermoanaerobaculia bacterium]